MYPHKLTFMPGLPSLAQIDVPSRNTQPKGLRVVPTLSNGQTLQEAFQNLRILYNFQANTEGTTRGSKTPINAQNQELTIDDMSTFRFGGSASNIRLAGGVPGQEYTFWVLELETEDIEPDASEAHTPSPYPQPEVLTFEETDVSGTAAAPSGVQGAPIQSAISFQITIESTDGSNIDPQGTLDFYIKDAAWVRSPQLDEQIAFWLEGRPRSSITFDVIPRPDVNGAIVPFDRIAVRPNGMANEGANTFSIYYSVTVQDRGITFTKSSDTGLDPVTAAETQAPTNPTDGISLEGVVAMRLIMTATGGTIEPGGRQVAFLLINGVWTVAEDAGYALSFQVDSNFTGEISFAFGDFQVSDLMGTRICYRPQDMVVPIEGGLITNDYRMAVGPPFAPMPSPNPSAGSFSNRAVAVKFDAATPLGTATAGRLKLLIQNLGSEPIYYGDANVTAANGTQLAQNTEIILDVRTGAQVFAIAKTTTQVSPDDTRIIEFYQ